MTALAYTLSGQPDRSWGAAPQEAPPSYSTGEAPAIGFLSGSGFGASQGSGYVALGDLGTNWGAPGGRSP